MNSPSEHRPNTPSHRGRMFTQKFRQLDACRSQLHSAVTAELAAETEENRRETARVKADNERRAAAVAVAAAAAQRTTPTAVCGEDTICCLSDGGSSGEGGDDDGYDSEVLVPRSPATTPTTGRDRVGLVAMSASEPTSALSDGRSTSVPAPLSAGDGAGPSAAGGATGAGKRSRPTATAASTASARSAPTAAGALKGGTRAAVRFLEDLLPAPGQQVPRRPKSRPRADAAARGGGNTGKRSKTTKRTEEKTAPPGPFSGLSLCVVHLGSVTSNTIKTFAKGVRGGGGQLSTHYTPGDTTHIVADASLALSWEKLDLYLSGWDDFEDCVHVDAGAGAEGNAAAPPGTRAGTPDGVPIVSSEWVSECLRLSAVVATDTYLLVPPSRRAAAAGARPSPAALAREPSAGAASATSSAAAAAAAGKSKLASANEEIESPATVSVRPPQRKQARGAVEGGAPAKSQQFPVEGGHGARNPNVGDKRHTFFCQATSSGRQVST